MVETMNSDQELLKAAFRESLLECENSNDETEDTFEQAMSRRIAENPKLADILESITPEILMAIMGEMGQGMDLEEDFEPMVIPHRAQGYRWAKTADWEKFTKDMKKNAHKTQK